MCKPSSEQADVVIEAHGLESDNGERLEVGLSPSPTTRRSLWSPSPPTGSPDRGTNVGPPSSRCRPSAGPSASEAFRAASPTKPEDESASGLPGPTAPSSALAALPGARRGGRGAHIDLSILEVANIIFTNFSEAMNRLLNGGPGDPEYAFLAPSVETPSIEPSADGYVGFCTNARQQFNDFFDPHRPPGPLGDEELGTVAGRGDAL